MLQSRLNAHGLLTNGLAVGFVAGGSGNHVLEEIFRMLLYESVWRSIPAIGPRLAMNMTWSVARWVL